MGSQTFIDLDTHSEFTYVKATNDIVVFVNDETIFVVPILETGWVDEKNVFLFTNNMCLRSHYFRRGYLCSDPSKIYSFFYVIHVYKEDHKSMSAHWQYSIDGASFETEPIFFEVEDLIEKDM